MRQTPLGESYHIERALAARQGIRRYPCGCQICHGFKTQQVQIVEKHHRKYGRDSTLLEPLLVSLSILYLCNNVYPNTFSNVNFKVIVYTFLTYLSHFHCIFTYKLLVVSDKSIFCVKLYGFFTVSCCNL